MMKTLLAADEPINLRPKGDFGKLADLSVSEIINGLIRGAMVVAALVFFFMLVLGGIKWIMSGGDKAKTEEARNQITSALIGLVIVFAAWAIISLVSTFFGGLNILDLTLPVAE